MARNYGLAAQLNCLNYCHLCKERAGAGSSRRWILADLTRDKVQELQKSGGEKEVGQPGWQGLVEEVTAWVAVGDETLHLRKFDCLIVSLFDCLIVSLFDCLIVSLFHCFIVSLFHCLIA